jgi:ABC-2 type transport system permease protein
MNGYAIKAIYRFEMARTFRTIVQSIAAPVITTSLYFIVFGAAIGGRMASIDGVTYGAFIVPGLIMLSILTESISNGSFGIYMPKWSGTIYEMLSAPGLGLRDPVGLCGRGRLEVGDAGPDHPGDGAALRAFRDRPSAVGRGLPGADLGHLQPVRLHPGVWADGFEKLSIVPLMVVTPLTFLAAASIRSSCCRRSGARSRSSTRWSTW